MEGEGGEFKVDVGRWKVKVREFKVDAGGWRVKVRELKVDVGGWKVKVGAEGRLIGDRTDVKGSE